MEIKRKPTHTLHEPAVKDIFEITKENWVCTRISYEGII